MDEENKYKRIAIWPGATCGTEEKEVKEFESWALRVWKVRIRFLENVYTPDRDVFGDTIEGNPGKTDLFFTVHEDDLEKFEPSRLIAGINWFKDMLNLRRLRRQYPQEILDKYS
ncbi:MAG: hypothetical protein WAX69_23290 [Victivallales bacterium]